MSQAQSREPRWEALLSGREALAARLIAYARERRWFRAKGRKVAGARIADVVPLDAAEIARASNLLVLLEVRYDAGASDLYALPLAWAAPDEVPALQAERPAAVIGGAGDGLVDGLATGGAAAVLFELAHAGTTRASQGGQLTGETSELLSRVVVPAAGAAALGLRVADVEQTNTTVMFGDRAILKVYRQLTPGANPELEIGRFLDGACDPPCAPRVLGALTYASADGSSFSVGILQELIANHGDAWGLAQRELARFFDRATGAPPAVPLRRGGDAWLQAVDEKATGAAAGRFPMLVGALGRRTGELHLALAGRRRSKAAPPPDFAPEPLTADDRRALADRTRTMFEETLAALSGSAGRAGGLPDATRALAERLLAPPGRTAVERLLADFRDQPLETVKVRTHGDLHLGQVLAVARAETSATGDDAVDDFVIIDFEGEPARPLHERRAKGSPLRDVMGMVRSFDYAPEAALRDGGGAGDPGRAAWARLWTRQVTAAYLRAYLHTVAGAPFIPAQRAQLARLLTYYELEKVVYEVGYELNNRPAWLDIPLRGLLAIAGLESD